MQVIQFEIGSGFPASILLLQAIESLNLRIGDIDGYKVKPLQLDTTLRKTGPYRGDRHISDVRESGVELSDIELADLSGNGFSNGSENHLFHTRIDIFIRKRGAIASDQFCENLQRIGD